jgi:NADH-quinone oxidoreductase subunit J
MSALGIGLFWLSALLAIAGGLGTVAAKSAIRSAMSLLVTILGIAGLYITLSAQLLAAVQIIVYAGAVVVLFVFVIMLIGGRGTEPGSRDDTRRTRAVATALFALVSAGALVLIGRAGIGGPHVFERPRPEFGSVYALGRTLFTDGVFAFELVGVLLLVAIVGVMAIGRARRAAVLPAPTANQEGSAS